MTVSPAPDVLDRRFQITGLHNRIGAIVCKIPLGPTEDPATRLRAINRETMTCKNGPEAYMCYGIAYALAMMPSWLACWAVDTLTGCTTCMLTNVRFFNGREFSIGGSCVRQLIPWVAPSPNIGCAWAITNWHSSLICAVTLDECLDVDPWELLELFRRDYSALAAKAPPVTVAGGTTERSAATALPDNDKVLPATAEPVAAHAAPPSATESSGAPVSDVPEATKTVGAAGKTGAGKRKKRKGPKK